MSARSKRVATPGQRYAAAFVRVFFAAVWLVLAIQDGRNILRATGSPWMSLVLFGLAVAMCVRSAFKAWSLR